MRTMTISPKALGEMYQLPRGIAGQVTEAIRQLQTNPFPEDSVPISGDEQLYSITVAGYTVVYQVTEEYIRVAAIS